MPVAYIESPLPITIVDQRLLGGMSGRNPPVDAALDVYFAPLRVAYHSSEAVRAFYDVQFQAFDVH